MEWWLDRLRPRGITTTAKDTLKLQDYGLNMHIKGANILRLESIECNETDFPREGVSLRFLGCSENYNLDVPHSKILARWSDLPFLRLAVFGQDYPDED